MAVVDIVAGVVGRAAAGELPSSRHLHGIQASCDPGTLSLTGSDSLELNFPHTAVGVGLSSHCCWIFLTLLLELNFPHTAVGVELSSHCC